MIRVLPPEVVNQIAAGEVVERPFSVVKELVENSLDAGADRVTVELEDGGCRLIRITDDGRGFREEDLALAFVSHATSKLSQLRDLEHIASLGFRGEALASIGAVSRARIKSRHVDSGSGFEVEAVAAEDGQFVVKPCGTPPGTTIEVRALFYNTPARRHFLRTPQAERARCLEYLTRLSLPRLDVDFTLISDGKQLLRLPAGESLRERLRRALGRKLSANLLDVDRESSNYRVEGVVADPDAARRDSTLELLFINGRLAKDRGATFAVRQAYREFLMHGCYPAYCLFLSLPPDEVDVNVHPTKAEVRFANARKACGVLHEAVRQALAGRGELQAETGDLAVAPAKPKARSGLPDLSRDLFGGAGVVGEVPVVPSRSPRQPDLPAAFSAQPTNDSADVAAPPPGDSVSDDLGPAAATTDRLPAKPNPFAGLAQRVQFLQVHDLYIVFESPNGGMVVVDQHALHERVLYERLQRRDEERGVHSQRLLAPVVVELTPSDKAWLLAAADTLAEEGLVLEDFGGNDLAVHAVPAVLGKANVAKLIESFLGEDRSERPKARDAIVERFHTMSCRAAIMAGDRLAEDEIRALLEEAAALEHPHNCPHGRPTVLTFSDAELERYFKRRV